MQAEGPLMGAIFIYITRSTYVQKASLQREINDSTAKMAIFPKCVHGSVQ